MDELIKQIRARRDMTVDNQELTEFCDWLGGYLDGYKDGQASISLRSVASPGPPGPTTDKPEAQP